MHGNRYRVGSGLVLLVLVLLHSPAFGAAGEPEPVLLGVEAGPDKGSYTVVVDGAFHYRLIPADDGLGLAVEIPFADNRLSASRLPAPQGLVKGISMHQPDDRLTRIEFDLSRPAAAFAVVSDRGLEVHLQEDTVASQPASSSEERPVGTEDLLEISVFEIPELNRTVRLSEQGTISLPLLGEVEAAGLTPRQLEVRLHDLLEEKYIHNPQVSVFVKEHGSKKVSVLGAVGKPGVYEMLGSRTLLQVLSQAGGLTAKVGDELYIIRTGADGDSERIAVNIDALLANGDLEINHAVMPGDIISVPIDRPIYIYVDGAVKSPGRLEELESRPITLLQAMAKAGGATDRANLKEIQILRKNPDGSQKVIDVNVKLIRQGKTPDLILEDGDVVVVPETFF